MTTTQRWLIALGIVGFLAVGLPWWLDPETKSMDEPAVESFPGSYVQLTHGHTRYRLQGPAGGETVLMIGGLTTSLEFFDELAANLNEAGYQTLQFDIFGRGGSARPSDLEYGQQTYVSQINELLSELGIDGAVHVVGQSLGGGISVAWAGANPTWVRSLFVHASAGHLDQLPPGAGLIATPLLGDYVWWWIGNGFVTGNVPNYFAEPEKQAAAIKGLYAQFAAAEQYEGYRQAVLSTLRNFGAENMRDQFSRLSTAEMPIQIVWGKEDALIPVTNSATLVEWIGGTPDLIVLDGVGHMPLLEDPEQVHRLVLDHIAAN